MAIELALDPIMQFFVPFLFVFAIVFGVLELATPKKMNRSVIVIISLAITFFAISYSPFITMLWAYLPTITWFFIAMFFIAFLLELFGLRSKQPFATPEKVILSGVVLFLLLTIGWSVIDQIPGKIPLVGDAENLLLLLGIIFIAIIFWAAFRMNTLSDVQKAIESSQKKQ
ncbi:MAG: hypothetical protein KJ906_00320 [Nanoarchaeota archaeon]|nr:hypothetical protein [Nanoarchaeota archaeon]